MAGRKNTVICIDAAGSPDGREGEPERQVRREETGARGVEGDETALHRTSKIQLAQPRTSVTWTSR